MLTDIIGGKSPNFLRIQMSEIKVVFAPGCFDNFVGTQEELDSLVEEIKRIAESGELLEVSQPVEFDDSMWDIEPITSKRTLN